MNRKNYEQVGEIADSILSGEAHFNRLSLAEEQGRARGGRTNVEASIILGADRQANPGRYTDQSRQEIIARQEQLLRDYAELKRLMIDEKSIADNAPRQFPSGFESNVYLSEDGKTVIKFLNYRALDNTPESFLDNRISLYDYLFPETSYTLIGFSEDLETGQFRFVLKQAFVHGKSVDFNDESEANALREEMAKRGFIEMASGAYINNDYALFDLRNGNVKITEEGYYTFIDIVTLLNEQRTGGVRQYGNGEIIAAK